MIARVLRPIRWAHEDGSTVTLPVGHELQAMRPPPGWQTEARQCGQTEATIAAAAAKLATYGGAGVLVWYSPTGMIKAAREGLDVALIIEEKQDW